MIEKKPEPSVDENDSLQVEYQGSVINVPRSIDGVVLYNRIVDIDTLMGLRAQNLEEPSRFESSFADRQEYLSEIAKIAGIREGISMIVQLAIAES
jgi:hypothetical protein